MFDSNGIISERGVSRRGFLSAGTAAATGIWLGRRSLLAQEIPPPARLLQMRAAAASAKIAVTPLRERVSVLIGSGGNMAVLAGLPGGSDTDGKLLIDSGFSTSKPQVAQALATLGPDPVKLLINTHWHFDHTDGNEWVHGAGATILAHENTLERMSTNQVIAAYSMKFGPSPVGARPTVTFRDSKTVQRNGATLNLKHFAPAHTDTDLSVHFVEADVLHAGDTFWNGFYPFIDYSSGGNIDGMIQATKDNLSLCGEKTVVIPGHGTIGNKAQLADFGTMLEGCRDAVAKLKAQGKTLAEAKAAKPTAPFDAKWAGSQAAADTFVGLVYQGI